MLGGKTVEELEGIREDIQKKLERGGRDVDVDYWGKVLGKCMRLPPFFPPSLPPASQITSRRIRLIVPPLPPSLPPHLPLSLPP